MKLSDTVVTWAIRVAVLGAVSIFLLEVSDVKETPVIAILFSFIFFWAIVLFPPILIKKIWAREFSNGDAWAIVVPLFVVNWVIFKVVFESENKTPAALLLGAVVSFAILRRKPDSTESAIRDESTPEK